MPASAHKKALPISATVSPYGGIPVRDRSVQGEDIMRPWVILELANF